MRITQDMIYSTMLNQVQRAASNLLSKQEVMATQKLINRVSDDPVAALRVLDLGHSLNKIDQYKKNIDRATTLQNAYDDSLDQTNAILERAKELMLSEASSAQSGPATRESVAVELISLRQQLLDVANFEFEGRYIYAGAMNKTPAFTAIDVTPTANPANTGGAIATSYISNTADVNVGNTYEVQFTTATTFDIVNTTNGSTISTGNAYVSGQDFIFDGVRANIADDTAPPAAGDIFQIDVSTPGVYQGDSQTQQVEIEKGHREIINLTGNTVFQGACVPGGGEDIFQLFQDSIDALRGNDINAVDASLDRFDSAIGQVIGFRASIGARQNIIDSTLNRLHNVGAGFEELKANLENADIATAITEFNQAQLAYEASLNATGKAIQPSLLDFL